MERQVVFAHRYRGLEDVALGGYVCGVVAAEIPSAAEVSLRRPPPLERELTLASAEDGAVQLRDGETLIAEGRPAALQLEVPARPSCSEAKAAAARFPYAERHPRPSCFVCGPDRADGLRIFPGPLRGRDLVAAPWNPDPSVAIDGYVRAEIVWAALDCPTYFGGAQAGEVDSVLAQMSGELRAPVLAGRPYVIAAWRMTVDGRKRTAGAALYSSGGGVCAVATGLWIERRGSRQSAPTRR